MNKLSGKQKVILMDPTFGECLIAPALLRFRGTQIWGISWIVYLTQKTHYDRGQVHFSSQLRMGR